jgi:hypothetical protein
MPGLFEQYAFDGKDEVILQHPRSIPSEAGQHSPIKPNSEQYALLLQSADRSDAIT